MIQTTQLDQRLRAADPATGLDADPDGPTALRLRARAMAAGRAAPAVAHHRPRKRVVVTAVAGLMLLGSVGALAAGMFNPDPDQVATILDEAEETGRHQFKTEDWRPTLRSERVVCAFPDGSIGSTSVAHPDDFPLDAHVADDDLVAACAAGSDGTRHLDTPEETTLCEGSVPAADIETTLDAMRESAEINVLDGTLTTNRPGFPVVLGWNADCSTATIEPSPERTELRPWTSTSTQDFNRAREVEIGLTAAAMDSCLTFDDSRTLASQASDQLAGDWLIVVGPALPDDAADPNVCARVWVDGLSRGLLHIQADRIDEDSS